MDYSEKLKYHLKPEKGWVNDPNGLVYYKGYYHIFYQYCPNFEVPWQEPMHWGHARTKNFIDFEYLPIALYPDKEYDNGGCWSGTAIVKDDVLYLFYASVHNSPGMKDEIQTVSIAYSKDGINFEKYEKNPVIKSFPETGSRDFRDPAVAFIDGKFRLVMATGYPETKKGRLLLYESSDVFSWEYKGILSEWDDSIYAECPSVIPMGEKVLISASVVWSGWKHNFSVMTGYFDNDAFVKEFESGADKGPDGYAGQIFKDHKGRMILISWIPGWSYKGYAEKDVGCMSVPREVTIKDGVLRCYPIEEIRHLLKDSDPYVEMTECGFIVKRENRESLVYNGKVKDIKILRDGFIMEIFVNGGKENYTVLL